MTAYEINQHLKLQLNLNNVNNKLYFTGIYYVGTCLTDVPRMGDTRAR